MTQPKRDRRNALSMADYAEVRLRGQDMPRAKLTNDDVLDIRSRHQQRRRLEQHISEQLSPTKIAAMYGISVRTVQGIVNRETWRHIA